MPLEELERDHQLVVDGALAQSQFVAIGHEFQHVFSCDLVDKGFAIRLPEELIEGVAVADVRAFFAMGLGEIQVVVDGLADGDALKLRVLTGLDDSSFDRGLPLTDARITARITLNITDDKRYVLGAELRGNIAGVSDEEARALMHAAHQICPYSNSMRGNVDVRLLLETDIEPVALASLSRNGGEL